ncbi:MAG: TonB family protein [Pseudomonadota bacterium]
MSSVFASLLLGSAAQAAPAVPPPPPVRVSANPAKIELAIWNAGEISCDNGAVLPGSTLRTVKRTRHFPFRRVPRNVTYSFTLGNGSRAMSVTQVPQDRNPPVQSDFAPAISASVFPAMDQEANCEVTFTREVTPIEEATLEDLVFYRVFDRSARVSRENWDVHFPGDCRKRPYRRPLLQAYPDFRELPQSPGAPDWMVMRYSTDEDGRAAGVELVASSGNEALNASGVEAISQSRWTEANRSGCVHYYWLASDVIEAPEAPPESDFGEAPVACNLPSRWETEPRLTYPNTFQRRGIEGWAILRYDVAPWGQIGNVEVLDAQPAAEFAQTATNVLRSAKFRPLDTGLKGCIERVFFRLPEKPIDMEE